MAPHDIRISVVITSYNQCAYLVEAIESVLGQTYPAHEIIVADDASSDGSREAIRDYERRFPGVVRGLVQERNVGIPRNRNAALRVVRGNYVGILDGDDCFLPRKLEQQVDALRHHPDATLVYGNFRVVDQHRRPLRLKWQGPQPSGFAFAEIAKCKAGLLRTLIVDYDAVRRAGFMDERFPRYDGLWLTILLASTCRLVYVDDVLVEKRDHPTGDSKTLTRQEHAHDLSLIYRELQSLLPRYATAEQAREIRAFWERLLARHAVDPAGLERPG